MKLVAEVVPVVGKIICSHILKFSTLVHILAATCNPCTLKVMLFRSIDRQIKQSGRVKDRVKELK